MRTTLVSTSRLKTGKIIGISIFTGLLIMVCLTAFFEFRSGQPFWSATFFFMWIYIWVLAIREILNLKNISYDDSSVFYEKKGFEVQIPFEGIKNIEIKSITGVYIINLFNPSQDGEKIPFKMPLWYPFNFKREDEKVHVLRDKIVNYKRQLGAQYNEQLSSRSIN